MKKNSLAAKNPYLQQASAGKMVARNIASSTAVETGKSSSIYEKRCTTVRAKKR